MNANDILNIINFIIMMLALWGIFCGFGLLCYGVNQQSPKLWKFNLKLMELISTTTFL